MSSESSSDEDAKSASREDKHAKDPSEDGEEDPEEEEEPRPAASSRSRRQTKQVKYADEDSEEDEEEEDEEDDDEDGAKRKRKAPAKRKARSPAKKRSRKATSAGASPKKARAAASETHELSEESDEDNEDEPGGEEDGEKPARKPRKTSSAGGAKTPKKMTRTKLLENAMKANKWWEAAPLPDKLKWQTLEHQGVQFPPPYEPHGVPLIYDGTPVKLTREQEEIATYYAACIGSQNLEKESTAKVFNRNFFSDFKRELGSGHVIQEFAKCDFSRIRAHLDEERERKKNLPKEEREALKARETEQKLKYCFAVVDGCLTKVANTLIEPPGLFRGRGEHPKAGFVKPRVMPEDVTLNLGANAPVPPCPIPGHSWGGIVTNQETTWLATWKDMSGNHKYVYLSASSHFKGMADRDKYEKARRLKLQIPSIRKDYVKNMENSDLQTKQIATATWVIDRLALRVGGEKDEDEADTVGTCSLRVEHIIIVPPKSITMDFLGKDSMRHHATYNLGDTAQYGAAGELAFKNFVDFTKGKKPTEEVFDRIDPTLLNNHLKSIMPGLSAKVFRTYNASVTLEKELPHKMPATATLLEKEAAYNDANRQVAILCNHQRTVSKASEAGLEKKHEVVQELEQQVEELRAMLKLVQKGKDIELRPEINDEDDKEAKRKTAHLFDRQPTEDQVENRIAQWLKRLETFKHKTEEAEKNKTVALNTSKINYMDPRISVAWCKRNEVPIEKVYSATQREKFPWAMSADESFKF